MVSKVTSRFWKLFNDLPKNIQKRARRNYRKWKRQPDTPGLHFKRVHDRLPVYSVRIGLDYRAVGILKDDTITWFWIGKHDDYERILKSF